MKVLQFLGRDAESDALLFTDAEGTQYACPLTDTLSDAVIRGVSPEIAQTARVPLTPREIQALLREGVSPAQIAEQSGTDIERIRRFEGPVNAEIQRAVSRVRNSRVGTEIGSPTLGDLVVDRLAQRGVDTDALSWRAARRPDGAWEVSAIFVADSVEQSASWSLSEATNLAVAKDDNARGLTEVLHSAEPIRALFPPVVAPGRAPEATPSDDLLERQEQLLSRLNAQRGRRQPVLIDFDADDDDAFGAPSDSPADDIPLEDGGSPVVASVSVPVPHDTDRASRPALKETRGGTGPSGQAGASAAALGAGRPREAGPTRPAAKEEEVVTTVLPPPASEASKKRRRTPVPSWDEIVFGSRPD